MAAPSQSPPASQAAGANRVQDLVSDFMAEKVLQDAILNKAPAPRRARLVLTVVMAIVSLAAWFAPYPTDGMAPAPSADASFLHTRAALALAAGQIESFTAIHGRLPHRLPEAGVEDTMGFKPGSGHQFSLTADSGGSTLTYDSSAPAAAFAHALEVVLGIAKQ